MIVLLARAALLDTSSPDFLAAALAQPPIPLSDQNGNVVGSVTNFRRQGRNIVGDGTIDAAHSGTKPPFNLPPFYVRPGIDAKA